MSAPTTLPWWRSGGIHLFEVYIGINNFVVMQYLFRRDLLGAAVGPTTTGWLYLAVLVACFLIGQRPKGGVYDEAWGYVTLIMPSYFATLSLAPLLGHPLLCCAAALALIIWKIGVCMSVCLHRYSAHGAFRCGPVTSFALQWVGCLANQGGAIWWAANHRCHHKFCDIDCSSPEAPDNRDPHSPVLDGSANAFSFLSKHKTVKECFVPSHCDNLAARVLDTWSFVPLIVETYFAYRFFGTEGVWVFLVGNTFSQCFTLWFNVINHMPHPDETEETSQYSLAHNVDGGQLAYKGKANPCRASDRHLPEAPNIFFFIINQFAWIGDIIGEATHGHHHSFGSLAHRPGVDLPFHVFVRPLEALGLIWQVNTKGRELPAKPHPPAPKRVEKSVEKSMGIGLNASKID